MFADRLKQARKNKGIRQIELAKLLNTTNTSVSNWENNFSKPDLEMIKKLCKVLDVSADYFLEMNQDELSVEEKNFVDLYRLMDEQGKEVIKYILKQEYKRIKIYTDLENSIEIMKQKLNNERDNECTNIPAVARCKKLENKILKLNKNMDSSKLKGIQGDEF